MKTKSALNELERLLEVQKAKETLYYFGVACFGKVEYLEPLRECRDKIKSLTISINLLKSKQCESTQKN